MSEIRVDTGVGSVDLRALPLLQATANAMGAETASDLLGGCLDIMLERGRRAMASYDPAPALATADPDTVSFTPCVVTVPGKPGDCCDVTSFEMDDGSTKRLAAANAERERICAGALQRQVAHVPRQ